MNRSNRRRGADPVRACLAVLIPLCCWTGTATAEWSHDPYENNLIHANSVYMDLPTTVTDGRDGVIVAWIEDGPSATYDLRVQRLDQDGIPQWGPGGVTALTYSSTMYQLSAVSDDNGGAYLGFAVAEGGYYRAHAQWIRYDGAIPWGGEGVELTPGAPDIWQARVSLAAEGINGCIAAWTDNRDSGTTGDDIYAQRVATDGTLAWSTSGLLVNDAAGEQDYVKVAPDGNGGAYLVWRDSRDLGTRSYDVYGQHLSGAGGFGWSTSGLAIDVSSDGQYSPGVAHDGNGLALVWYEDANDGDHTIRVRKITTVGNSWWNTTVSDQATSEVEPACVPDGNGGIYVAWRDYRDDGYDSADVYAQWIGTAGGRLWTTDGVRVGASDGIQDNPRICQGGSGDVIIGWLDSRAGSYGQYAQRITATGGRAWNYSGVLLCSVPGGVNTNSIAADGRGGAVCAWRDNRNPGDYTVSCQRVGVHGFLGDASPQITGVSDYPQDQGGTAVVDWTPSYLDDLQYGAVYSYGVWRSYSGVSKAAAPAAATVADVSARTGLAVQEIRDLYAKGWAFEGEVEAFQFDEYAYHASTYGDSTDAGIPLTAYKVLALGSGKHWESNVVSGYSVDDLAPGAPLALAAQPEGADIGLDWSAAGWRDEDLAHYRVYRGTASGFPVDAEHFLSDAPDTLFTDAATGPGDFYYRVTGIDVHGNEGEPSNEAVAQSLSGVGGELPTAVRLAGNHPNPFNPSTLIAFDLPATMHVRLEVFTVDGRRVAVPHEGTLPAGRRQVMWLGRDDRGRSLSSGTYVYRLTAGDVVETGRMMLLK